MITKDTVVVNLANPADITLSKFKAVLADVEARRLSRRGMLPGYRSRGVFR
jgi:hypothetical protein